MKDPQRLLDDGATELELMLLRAGDAEGPSLAARRLAASSLGISAAITTTAASGAAAAGAQSLVPAATVFAAKWWVIGALVSVGAGVSYVSLTAGEVAPRPVASVAPVALAPPPTSSSPVASAEGPILRPESQLSAVPERAPVTAPHGGPATPVGIQEQVSLIDRARSAAASGQVGATLAALDEYHRRFPRGVLQQEAAMLRIEAMLARGDKATATRLGKRFLEQYPRSALAARVRSLLED